MKKNYFILAFSALFLTTTSCATIISGSKQAIKFTSTPSEATVFIDEVEVGKTPFETKLERKRGYNVMIKLEGYKPYETKLTKEFNAWYLGNILFGGIIGLVIDPITGAIYNLTPKQINAQLGEGTAFKTSKNGINIAVSLKIDENWKKVGQMVKL
ncbi:PEGA domain-containing protein [Elizabethkingia miricola]|uniref:PEGA domain-containing protein n=1 Tax=Elizabethkingia miricola TaxID=172045 RepID=A0ABD5BA03_ELIMR|nr:PEGA domain-containing protein [Elizabethkingia miricola]MDQ8750565.1 PEGA domain-containing protein [Elizabethkingia miricola]NHQ68696.1 PEGA domain-containing protein [Elizabethkingia miricola]NHQ71416.1 PEGA domain-containing protein [Elizabethkingia miricola]NHQ79845.1 PEGA domain-containing protein [Elizabethkingia miricola]OBS12450.1 PEGA domain-containing protein [Elizabethkingia miricola]